jgi:hypothetical protein
VDRVEGEVVERRSTRDVGTRLNGDRMEACVAQGACEEVEVRGRATE